MPSRSEASSEGGECAITAHRKWRRRRYKFPWEYSILFFLVYGADDISITLLFFYGPLNEIESAGVKCISFLGMLRWWSSGWKRVSYIRRRSTPLVPRYIDSSSSFPSPTLRSKAPTNQASICNPKRRWRCVPAISLLIATKHLHIQVVYGALLFKNKKKRCQFYIFLYKVSLFV